MDQIKEPSDVIPESKAARWAYHLALVPIFGLFLYMFASFVALYQIGKGRTGLFLLSKGFWRMLRMTTAGVIGAAAIWFCPYKGVHKVETFFVQSTGYGFYTRGFSYSAPPLKTLHWTYYSENGDLYEGDYWLDEKDGLWIWTDSRGKILEKGVYNYGVKNGNWIEQEEGRLTNSIEMDSNSKDIIPDIIIKTMPEINRAEGAYKNGKKDGLWITYDFAGRKSREVIFSNGEITGWTQYCPDGSICEEVKFINGKVVRKGP